MSHNSCSSGFDEIFRKKEENLWGKKKPSSLLHFLQNWPENLGIFFLYGLIMLQPF